MDVAHDQLTPGSQISIDVEPNLRRELAKLAHGRPLVIDYFATRRCSIVIGDLTARFRRQPPGERYIELASVNAVRIFLEERLITLLTDAGLSLRLAGPSFARRPVPWLDRPERWIEFLEQPGVSRKPRRGVRDSR